MGTPNATAFRSIAESLLGTHIVIVTREPILASDNFTGAIQANGHGAWGQVVLGAIFISLTFTCGGVCFLNDIRVGLSSLDVNVISNGYSHVLIVRKSGLWHSGWNPRTGIFFNDFIVATGGCVWAPDESEE